MNTSVGVAPDSIVVGTSIRMHAVFEFLRVIGTSESTVLVTGESGTGKEVTATLIHQASRRRHRPFVAVSCALFTETLIESEPWYDSYRVNDFALGQEILTSLAQPSFLMMGYLYRPYTANTVIGRLTFLW